MTGHIIRGDARRLPIPDNSVHLIATSPPYNAAVAYDSYDDSQPWDDWWYGLIEPSLRECYRVLVHGGRLALNIANVVRGETWAIPVAPAAWRLLADIGFLYREQLTWLKGDDPADIPTRSTAWGTFTSAQNPVLRATAEPVLIASKGSHSREPGRSDLTAEEFKAWSRNAWAIPNGHRDLPHPAMFPLELPRRLIKMYSYVADVVLDPFAGSGTTVRAAVDTGRVGIGVEWSEAYCRLAASRSAQQVLL